jgi:lambda family phage portal protein
MWLDKAIGFFSPHRELQRMRARHATRIYEGAAIGRRTSSWKALHTSENAELMFAIRPLRDRARELARNTPHAARMLDVLTAHIIGNGIIPVSSTGKDKWDNLVNQLFADWQEVCDITEMMDFYTMQTLATRAMIESGEVVIRLIDRPLENGLPVPLQLQILESDYIDQFRDGIYGTQGIGGDLGALAGKELANALRRSRLGVALGDHDRFLGLWLFRNHPGELNTIWQAPYTSDLVSADQLIHMFKILRPGQVRGVPWMAPILTTARDLADFLDAANVKARIEACFSAFITNDDSTIPLFDPAQAGTLQVADYSNPNASQTTLEPGMMKELRSGQDIKFAAPTSTSQIEPIMMFDLQAMASGVGCTYDQVTGDLRQANYSSLRAGKLDFWRLVGQLQKHVIVPKLCNRVWKRFISRAILSGALQEIPGGYPVDWVVPAKEYIDPKKDADAEKNEVRSGRVTPQSYIAARGGNWRSDLKDFKDFFDKAHEYGVMLDIDVGKVDQHGRQVPTKAEPGDGADAVDVADLQDKQDEQDNADRVITRPFFTRLGA